jgi:drug/metabolite transporter (DMT)-like permease
VGATPEASQRFGVVEWALTATVALVWGASFLFIRIGLQTFGSGMVPTMRIAFGMAAIACVPRSHAKIDTADWPRVALLGLLWLALPFLLYSLAERTVSTAVTGIINGAVPLTTAAVGVVFQRRRPSARRALALVLGFAGVSLVALSASRGAHPTADARGILMLVAAITCYGLAMNVMPPLQRRYGAFPVLFRAQMVALVLSLPVAIASLPAAHFAWGALAAMIALGTLGTGLAYVALAVLIGRTDATRGTIGNFFTPIVASLLGATLLHEPLTLAMLAGAALVLAGAYVTSHPEPQLRPHEGRLAVERAADE